MRTGSCSRKRGGKDAKARIGVGKETVRDAFGIDDTVGTENNRQGDDDDDEKK